jgi:uncharacterized membrane protein YkvA (DUF1232 family)
VENQLDPKQQDFYKKLRNDVKSWLSKNLDTENKWSDYVLAAPDLFHLLCKLSADNDVPSNKKLKLLAGIAYFISPIDLLPEMFLGAVGYLDDIAVSAYILNDLVNEIDPQIIRKHWAGEQDILDLIKTILANADSMIGSKLWNKIRRRF